MRCTKTVLFLLIWGVIAPGRFCAQALLNQQLDFFCKDCRPADALVALSRKSGVNIVFSDRQFEQCPPVTVQAMQESLKDILETIASCNHISFKAVDGQVVFFKKSARYVLSGYVQDAETGERIIGAIVRANLPEGGYLGAVANEFGFFSLKVEEGEIGISVSYPGYTAQKFEYDIDKDRLLRLKLMPNTSLKEVVVSNLTPEQSREKKSGSPKYLDLNALHSIPMPGGEPDLLRQTALESGIQTGVDGLGGLHVRGGNADQNLFLLDDVPVYSPSHALGLFSIFNPSTVSSVRLWKGDFPARYSGRASSVLDVRTRDGDSRHFRGEASAGLFATSAVVEGPIKKEKGSFMLGGRTTYFEPWVRFFSERGDLLAFSGDKVRYRFFDANLKLNYAFGDKDRVFLSLYHGGDLFRNHFDQSYDDPQGYITDQSDLSTEWGNDIAALRWNHLLKENLFTNTTIRYSRFFYQSKLGFSSNILYPNGKLYLLSDYAQLYQTLIGDWSGKTDFTFFLSDKLTLRWGFSYTDHDFQPGTLSANFLQPGQTQENIDSLANILQNNERLNATETEAYLEGEFDFWKNWRLEMGLNGTAFETREKTYQLVQPRLRLRRSGPDGWDQWIGWHRMAQNLHQIGSFNVSFPFELWVPSTRKVPPEIVWQLSAGTGWHRNGWSWQVEAYYKKMDRVLSFITYNDALFTGGAVDASGWEDRITAGTGKSRGLEIDLGKSVGRFKATVAYTLSESTRFFPELNAGKPFPFRFDRRHDLKVTMGQQLLPWMDANVVWTISSGNPITLAGVKFRHESVEGAVEREVFFYTEVNGYRLPAYHRLDAALNMHWKIKSTRHTVQLGAYNSYNRSNPFYLFVDAGSSIRGKAIQYTLLPVLPVFRYGVKF